MVSVLRRYPPASELRAGMVIFKPDRMGDFILAIEAIKRLDAFSRKEFQKPVTLIIADLNEPLARHFFPDINIVALPFPEDRLRTGFFRLIGMARREFASITGATVVCLRHQRNVIQDLLLSWLQPSRSIATVNCWFAITEDLKSALSFQATDPIPYPDVKAADLPAELTAHAAVATRTTGEKISASELLPEITGFSTQENGNLLVFPFSSSDQKDYPIPQLVKVLTSLPRHLMVRIVLCGSPTQHSRLAAFNEILAFNQLSAELLTPSSPIDTIRAISQASLILTMDSAPAHIATALDKRAVILLGGGHFGLFGPWFRSERQQWLIHSLPCFGCETESPSPESDYELEREAATMF